MMPESSDHWRPSASFREIRRRAELLYAIRQYFFSEKVMEVETPVLSSAATVDPHIDSFYTDFSPRGGKVKRCYLHTSPEFPMKRLLSAGSGDLYSLGRVFRNGEAGARHNPEFTMLEWYRVGLDHHQLMDDVSALLSSILDNQQYHYQECQRISYGELFERYFSINPHQEESEKLMALVNRHVDSELVDLSRNDCLDLLFSHIIEPTLGECGDGYFKGVFVYDYPVTMAALSRLIDDEKSQQVAARFELFINGVELANGYYELAEGHEQLTRFQKDQTTRKAVGMSVYPYDERLVNALSAGFPDCSGVALGVDRLHMLLAGSKDIRDVLAFDFYRA